MKQAGLAVIVPYSSDASPQGVDEKVRQYAEKYLKERQVDAAYVLVFDFPRRRLSLSIFNGAFGDGFVVIAEKIDRKIFTDGSKLVSLVKKSMESAASNGKSDGDYIELSYYWNTSLFTQSAEAFFYHASKLRSKQFKQALHESRGMEEEN